MVLWISLTALHVSIPLTAVKKSLTVGRHFSLKDLHTLIAVDCTNQNKTKKQKQYPPPSASEFFFFFVFCFFTEKKASSHTSHTR